MILEISPEALFDLREIALYTTESWGVEQTDLYLNQIHSTFDLICRDTSCFRYRNDLFEGCQLAPVGKHIIFFEVDTVRVGIVRVLHERMNIPDHF